MDHARTFGRVGELSEAIATPLRTALEKTRSFETTPRAGNDWDEERRLYEPALLAAGFSRHEPRPPGATTTVAYSARAILEASQLSPEQRVLAEILAYVTGVDLTQWPVPAAAWVRRQWLGLEPAGPLFALQLNGRPAYHAVRDAAPARASMALVETLPTNDQIALLLDLYLARVDCRDAALADGLAKRGASIDENAGAWARATATRILALFDPSTAETERGQHRAHDVAMTRPIFLGLARAGVPIEAAWHELLPLDSWAPEAQLHECIDAIPEASREDALAIAIPRVKQYWHLVALKLLPRYPYRRVADRLLESLSTLPEPKAVVATLTALAAEHPAIADALAAKQSDLDHGASFSVGPIRVGIALEALTGVDRAQLEAASRSEVEPGEPRLPAQTWAFRIDRSGVPAYDAWLTTADSGVVFRTGTTEVVAEIVQGGIERADGTLRMALKDLLADAKKKRTKPRKASASKAKSGKPKRSK